MHFQHEQQGFDFAFLAQHSFKVLTCNLVFSVYDVDRHSDDILEKYVPVFVHLATVTEELSLLRRQHWQPTD